MPKDEFDPEDPMEWNAIALPGDTMDAMAECFIEEFARMGYTDEMLLKIFKNPFYVATHNVYKEKGEEYVKGLIEKVRKGTGYINIKMEVTK
ncbi:MAG: hypothetical protein A2W23_01325 [Planctomycetes bacterium RBG_16_43_13]|nr:MAG: hypothetical protein A2W23_01325 [Planctomycetes bacterium RBG_16_43_13]